MFAIFLSYVCHMFVICVEDDENLSDEQQDDEEIEDANEEPNGIH